MIWILKWKKIREPLNQVDKDLKIINESFKTIELKKTFKM
jgi:hypothetical protein